MQSSSHPCWSVPEENDDMLSLDCRIGVSWIKTTSRYFSALFGRRLTIAMEIRAKLCTYFPLGNNVKVQHLMRGARDKYEVCLLPLPGEYSH